MVHIRLRTDREAYAPGSSVTVELINDSDQHVFYNLCFGYVDLERKVGDRWRAVRQRLHPAATPATADTPMGCHAVGLGLPPGARAADMLRLPADLPVGTYRLLSGVTIDDERGKLASTAFSLSLIHI